VIDPASLSIRTPRLVLRIPGREDAARVLAFVAENRSHLEPWEPPRAPAYYTLEGTASRLEQARREAADDQGYRFYVFDGARVIGTTHLSVVVRGPLQSCFLGYALAAAEEGKGLMREAVAATLAFAWDVLRLHRVEAGYAPHNVRSGRLLRALGFTVEGYCRDYLFTGGAWQDNVRAALLNPRFPADWGVP
jgi:ribosomal-protein-alanine N-acetyltransferase